METPKKVQITQIAGGSDFHVELLKALEYSKQLKVYFQSNLDKCKTQVNEMSLQFNKNGLPNKTKTQCGEEKDLEVC